MDGVWVKKCTFKGVVGKAQRIPTFGSAYLRLIDVLANRIGSPVDGVLSIFDEAGNQLATTMPRCNQI